MFGLLKKKAAAFMIGFVIFGAPFSVSEAGTEAYELITQENRNVAIPLVLGKFKDKMSLDGAKLTVNLGHDFLMVLDDDFNNYRAEFCEALAEFSRENRIVVNKQLAEFENYAKELSEPQPLPLSAYSNIDLRRADMRAVSALACNTLYGGGAHPNYLVTGANFDVNRGTRLSLEDICNDIPQFIDIVEQKITEQYPDANFIFKDDYFAKIRNSNGRDFDCWMLENEGVTIFFNPYSVASFADGLLMVTVPFAGHEDLFNEYFTKTPADYAVPVVYPVNYGFKADGSHKQLAFYTSVADDGMNMSVVIDNNRLVDDDLIPPATNIEAMYIHLGGAGEDYLYVFLQRVEYYQLNIYRITTGVPKRIHMIEGMRRAVRHADYEFTELGTDPSAMILEKLTDLIDGTYTRGIYTVGADGLPVLIKTVRQ